MAESGKRCDCELSLDEATTGDLPAVCVWCGEAAEFFPTAPLKYQSQRVRLRLPLCRRHASHWGWSAWAAW
jgi:hypothetical protein